jgi:hypothetical protein
MKKRKTLLFSSIETLSSFVSASTGINVYIMVRAKIVKGLFSDEDIEQAITKFNATEVIAANSADKSTEANISDAPKVSSTGNKTSFKAFIESLFYSILIFNRLLIFFKTLVPGLNEQTVYFF